MFACENFDSRAYICICKTENHRYASLPCWDSIRYSRILNKNSRGCKSGRCGWRSFQISVSPFIEFSGNIFLSVFFFSFSCPFSFALEKSFWNFAAQKLSLSYTATPSAKALSYTLNTLLVCSTYSWLYNVYHTFLNVYVTTLRANERIRHARKSFTKAR